MMIGAIARKENVHIAMCRNETEMIKNRHKNMKIKARI